MLVGLFAHRLSERQPTGIGRYLRELVVALAELEDPRARFLLSSTREGAEPAWVPSGVETRIVPWPRRPVQAAWTFGLGPRLERAVGGLDVVHLIQQFPPVKTSAPQLVTIHDTFPLEHADWYPRSEQWTYRRSMQLLRQRARRIVVPSSYVAERVHALLAIPHSQIDVVALGVSGVFGGARDPAMVEAVCARHNVSPGRYAICIGQVSTRKNLVPVVRALPKLPADQRVPLVMVGPDGHGVESVEAEISRLDGDARVTRTGFLPDAEAAALVAGAVAVVHPTLGEGFGFVPLEAMAAGTPVIAARASSVPEVAGQGALLVDDASEPDAWAQAISAVLADPGKRAAMVAAGEQRAADFSWRRSAARLLDIYLDLAGA